MEDYATDSYSIPKLLFSQRDFYTCPKAQNSLRLWDNVVWNLGK